MVGLLMEMRWTGCGNGAPGDKCLDRNRWKLGTSVGLGLLIIKVQKIEIVEEEKNLIGEDTLDIYKNWTIL